MRKFIGTFIFLYLMLAFILYFILVSVKAFLNEQYLELLIVPLALMLPGFAIYAFIEGNKK